MFLIAPNPSFVIEIFDAPWEHENKKQNSRQKGRDYIDVLKRVMVTKECQMSRMLNCILASNGIVTV